MIERDRPGLGVIGHGKPITGTEVPVGTSDFPKGVPFAQHSCANKRDFPAAAPSLKDALIGLDREERIVLFSPAAEALFGYAAAEILDRPMGLLLPDRFRAVCAQHLARFGQSDNSCREVGALSEVSGLRASGEEFPMEAVYIGVTGEVQCQSMVILRDLTGRKAAEVAQAWLAAIVTDSEDAILSKTLEGTITSWNEGARRLFGYAPDEMIGQPVSRLIPPDRLEEEAQILARLKRDERVEHYETVRTHRDGRLIDVSLSISPIHDGRGQIIGASKVARDITRRKEAEVALRQAHERLREQAAVLELAQVFVRDLDGRIVQWNLGAERLYGFSKAEALGRVSRELLSTQFPEPQAQIEDTLRRTGKWEGDLVRRTRHGESRVVSSQWALHADAAGHPVRIFEADIDITERKRATQSLQESEARFRTMVNLIPQLAWIAQADGSVVWYNQRWHDYTGTTAQDMEGWGWQRVHDPLLLPTVLERWQGSIATGQPFDMEIPLRGADGRFRLFLTRVMPLKDAEGRVLQWFGTNTDISQREELDRMRREVNAQLEQRVTERTQELAANNALLARSNADLEQFAAVASHDLQEPLRAMAGCAQILERKYAGQLDERAHELIAMMVAGAARMKALIADLLAYSKAGQNEALETIDTGEVLQQTLANLTSALHESQAEVTSEGLPSLCFTRAQFAQVLQNLVGNALKYRREVRPRIHLQAHRQGESWVFRVADNGIGFEPQDAEKIFGVFQRLHTREDCAGTGIGLSIVKKVIERRGGKIWAESTPGQGSTFFFSVPDQDAPLCP